MALIPNSVVRQISETANDNIVSIIGDYAKLMRRGANYMGCCPFHSEKTPSFSVNPAKGFFHCFGCGKSGSAVSFIMEIEKISFPDAIRLLGNRLGISVPEEELTPEQDAAARRRDAQYSALEYAARLFEANLTQTEEGQALGMTYWRSRGFRDDIISKFRLGYALTHGDQLITKATTDGFAINALMEAGLVSGRELNDPHHDYFRGRVMFPIQGTTGKVLGFGGRVLDAATKGVNIKYLNTPETELYNKRETLYGIYQARSEISRTDKCFLVEGYTDVIAMHQCGIANAVASTGTSLTTEQIRLIKRFTKNVTILYDGDKAGVHASLRAIDMILHEGLNVRLLLLPDDDDPDSFSRKHTAEEFQAYVTEHEVDFLNYEKQALLDGAGDDPLKKAQAIHTIVASIAQIDDALTREVYVKQCAQMMGMAEKTVYDALGKQLVDNATRQRDLDVAEQRRQAFAEQRAAQQAAAAAAAATQQQLPPDIPPDLSPSELAQLGLSSAPSAPAPRAAQQPQAQPEEVEMKEVLRFFVSYTQEKMELTEGQPSVAQYIIESLDADQIPTQNPTFNKILNEYRNAPDPTTIDERHFINMADEDVARFVAWAVGSRQPLSRIHSRYTVVKDEDEQLDVLVPRAVDELRMKVLNEMLDDAMLRLSQATSDEEAASLMEHIAKLTQVKKTFAEKRLGERAICR